MGVLHEAIVRLLLNMILDSILLLTLPDIVDSCAPNIRTHKQTGRQATKQSKYYTVGLYRLIERVKALRAVCHKRQEIVEIKT